MEDKSDAFGVPGYYLMNHGTCWILTFFDALWHYDMMRLTCRDVKQKVKW